MRKVLFAFAMWRVGRLLKRADWWRACGRRLVDAVTTGKGR